MATAAAIIEEYVSDEQLWMVLNNVEQYGIFHNYTRCN